MKILALETSEIAGSVAALDSRRVLAQLELDRGRRSATTLAPTVAELFKEVGWKPRDVELVAVASGPGSFTGLRIGVTTAKTFAYAVGCPIVGVNTLAAIALGTPPEHANFWAVIDAQRQEVFAGSFTRSADGDLHWGSPTAILSDEAWLASLRSGDAVTGPALHRLAERIPAGVTITDSHIWSPTAVSVGLLGQRQHAAGSQDDAFNLAPNYFRRTAAEEQWDRKRQAAKETY